MPGDAAEVLRKDSEHLRRILIIHDGACNRVGKKLQDPADDHAVSDGDAEGSDDRDETDHRSGRGTFPAAGV